MIVSRMIVNPFLRGAFARCARKVGHEGWTWASATSRTERKGIRGSSRSGDGRKLRSARELRKPRPYRHFEPSLTSGSFATTIHLLQPGAAALLDRAGSTPRTPRANPLCLRIRTSNCCCVLTEISRPTNPKIRAHIPSPTVGCKITADSFPLFWIHMLTKVEVKTVS